MEEKEKQISNNKSKQHIQAVGRRKEAVARVRLVPGKGQTTVNGIPIENYFPSEAAKTKYLKPFHLTKSEDKYFASIKVAGSGKSGQLDAVVHGIARALNEANRDFRPFLKRAGLLTRDPRVKERRKYGLAQKARKGKQSPKR
ncbi:MAG: Ribosomal protein S9 [Candidatus Curtissbacteria bacterium GW2011_GWA1_40_16]|uniref:Small ribosomal subunit protein uS9 n=1 Tax=Candidatus Curtissbacteria bacterium GW2011_GWA1_40_16 TaxID=1618405 RepID=A0A0G0TR82_9BACT|nr:MAG: Ribosomal protein S9 [Candidatus Curtissbacteria bacterium GW2011_GWA1_40_16]